MDCSVSQDYHRFDMQEDSTAMFRYIYVPLGGSQNTFFTTILVFTFVALWHVLSFKLLACVWLASVFFIPELTARYLFPARKVSSDNVDRLTEQSNLLTERRLL